MPYDDTGPIPAENVRRLIEAAESDNTPLVVGADANAHHTLWGSSGINNRGECLFDYIMTTNLVICNKGSEPTFINRIRQEVIDITLATNSPKLIISKWMVSRDVSFSDHRYIQFNIDLIKPPLEHFRNPKKTNWQVYNSLLRQKLGNSIYQPNSPSDIDYMVDKVTKSMNEAFKRACPISRHRKGSKPPWWNTHLSTLRKASRKCFNLAKSSRLQRDWDNYKISVRQYKAEITKAQRQSWRLFCGNIESTTDSSRLRKIISKSPPMPSFIQKPCGEWTSSNEETLDLLMNTHFPGNTTEDISSVVPNYPVQESPVDIVNGRNIYWAVNSFLPYKSPGPDNITPVEIQKALDTLTPWLEVIFRTCLKFGYTPESWRRVKVIFIPKGGKASHVSPKDLRPISLSSF